MAGVKAAGESAEGQGMRKASPLDGATPTGKSRRWHRPAILVLAWLLLSAAGAVELVRVQGQGKGEIEARYRLRAETTSRFIDTYVNDFFAQERRAATRALSGKEPARGAFNRTLNLIGARGAVLLDDRGDLIESAPAHKKLLGTNLSDRDGHLRSAVEGVPSVSNIVRSTVDGVQVIDFAVPFESSAGTRVFSGSFDVGSTPLAGYIRRAAVLAPNRIYVIDASGKVFASNDRAQEHGATLAPELAAFSNPDGRGLVSAHSEDGDYLVSNSVPGTPWRLVIEAPRSTIYAAVGGIGRLIPWVFWFGFVTGGLLSITLFERLSRRRRHLSVLNGQLERLARVDALTGMPNRRATEEELERALASSDRYEDPLSILMVDIDCFKEVNDGYGHAAGDAALKHVAEGISASLRGADLAGRWAGDEFLLILPHLNEDEAATLAARLVEHIGDSPLRTATAEIELKLSIGVAQWRGEDASELIDRADKALYDVKRTGRNSFAIAPGETTPFPLSSAVRQL